MAFTRDDLRRAVRSVFRRMGEDWPAPDEELVEIVVGALVHNAPRIEDTPSLPAPGETIAVAPVTLFKTTALCHDRVASYSDSVPESIAFRGCTGFDLDAYATAVLLELVSAPRQGLSQLPEDSKSAFIAAVCTGLIKTALPELQSTTPADIRAMMEADEIEKGLVIQARVAALREERGCQAVPVYDSHAARDREYGPGDASVVVCTLSGLRVVDEDALTWDKVMEFRDDEKAKDRYRSLIHWLDGGMVGKSHAYIEREIAERLKAYEDALDTHKIKTKLGVLEGLLDGKFIFGGAAATVAAASLAGPLGALAVGGVMLLGRTAATVARHKLDAKAVHGDHKEIAWVYDVKRKLGE